MNLFAKIKTYRDEEIYLVLDEIRNQYNNVVLEVDLKKIGRENNIHNTLRALIMLSLRMSQLCESILSCNDPYTTAIIYRATIEYSFKHLYLFKSCIKNGDSIAKEYCEKYISSELMQKALKSLRPRKRKPTEEFKNFKKELDGISDRFRFSKILENIIEELGKNNIEKILRSIAVQYSALSSYVHAGPMAVLESKEIPKKNLDMNAVLLTIIAYRDTINFLSSYSSEYQNKLKELFMKIDEKANKTWEIYEKNYIS